MESNIEDEIDFTGLDELLAEEVRGKTSVPERRTDLNWKDFRFDYSLKTKDELVKKYPQLKLNTRMNKNSMLSSIYQYKLYKPRSQPLIKQLFNPDPEVNKLIDNVIAKYTEKVHPRTQGDQLREMNLNTDVSAKIFKDKDFYDALYAEQIDMRDFHLMRIDFTQEFDPQFMKKGDEESHTLLAENFQHLCENTPSNARILMKLFTDEGKEIYMQLNEEQMEWMVQIIKNGGEFFKNPSEYEGYTEGTKLLMVKIIDIDQLPEEKQRRMRRYLAGFPYVHLVEHSPYTKYQIYGYKDLRDDENCFVHSLRVSGLVPEDKMASIDARIGSLPYINFKGVDFIASIFKLNISVTILKKSRTNGKMRRAYKTFLYGGDSPEIKLGCYEKHFIFLEKVGPNRDSLKAMSDLLRLKQVKPIRIGERNKEDHFLFDWAEEDLRPYKTESSHFMSRFLSKIKDLYQVGGNLERIIRKCLRGGRCLISQKKLHVMEEVMDLDYNALYMYALTKLFIQCGKPKKMPSFWTLGYILEHIDNEISQAFMEIEITKIGKERKYPVITNLKPGYYWVDTITLQDLIRFHEIEARFIRGLYYDGRRDYSIQNHIRQLYEKRRILELTDQGEEADKLKLQMNRIYGNACRLPRPMKFRDMSKEDVESFMIANFDVVSHSELNEDDPEHSKVFMFKEWTNSFNMCNFAVSICSMARHIMNEILYKCEDNGIEVFYSDTDSLFIRRDDFDLLNSFYGGNLIGDDLGQMKSDIKDRKQGYRFDYALEAIFLAKKQYCLKLMADESICHVRRAFISSEKLGVGKEVWKYFKGSCGEH